MLDLSKVEAGSLDLEWEHVELEDVARSVLDEFQIHAQAKGLDMSVDDGAHLTAWCDEQRLAQVLRALVDNAVKFSPPGSSIRIQTRGEDQWATVVVSDDGPGIPAGELPHVFERFHRGSEERATTAGAGLGLSIARELTEMMGGTIRAEAGPGRGASFLVRLPRERRRRAPEATPPPAPVPETQPAEPGGRAEPAPDL
jgi:signal transduction histidine kinase